MTELCELIAITAIGEEEFECPFSHSKRKYKDKTNVMPKDWGDNDAKKLATSLEDAAIFEVPIDIEWDDKEHKARYSAHHLIPGEASWPNTKLQKWVEKGVDEHIQANIGYDVNGGDNGISLPSWHGYPQVTENSWKALITSNPKKATEYAIRCMESSSPVRQFHDAHPAYNEFVVNVLDKVAAKLEAQLKKGGSDGCGKKNCAAATKSEKPYPAPINLIARIDSVAERLRKHLTGSPKNWKKPIITSRFSLVYKESIEEKEAAKQLSQSLKEQKKHNAYTA